MSNETPASESLIAALVDPEKEISALAEALKNWKLKNNEKEIIGDMLVEFFESERVMDDLIISVLRYKEGAFENAKESLLPFIPARKKAKFLKEMSVMSKDALSLFQRLHDERNNLAHPRGRSKLVSQAMRKKFVDACRSSVNETHKAHVSLYEEEKKRQAQWEEKIEENVLKSLVKNGLLATKTKQSVRS